MINAGPVRLSGLSPEHLFWIVHAAYDLIGKAFGEDAVKYAFRAGYKIDRIERLDFVFQSNFRDEFARGAGIHAALFVFFHFRNGTDDPSVIFVISGIDLFPDSGKVGFDIARLNCADADAVGPDFIDQGAGIAVDRCFGGRVVCLERYREYGRLPVPA